VLSAVAVERTLCVFCLRVVSALSVTG